MAGGGPNGGLAAFMKSFEGTTACGSMILQMPDTFPGSERSTDQRAYTGDQYVNEAK